MRITTKQLTTVFIVLTVLFLLLASTTDDRLLSAICYLQAFIFGFSSAIGVISTIVEKQEKI